MDPFNPDTRKYVFQQMKQNYMKYNIKTLCAISYTPNPTHVQTGKCMEC
eukprot:COSAG01_NODE_381_length_17848_cov_10.220338_20_plen_49_part_00